MTKQEREAQITGFQSKGNVGYLRQSWGSLEAWDAVFKAMFGIGWSEMLYPGWNGCNDGEGPNLSDEKERDRLIKNRDLLLSYIQNPAPPPEELKRYFRNWDDADAVVEIIKAEAQDVVDFINLALSKEGAKILFC
jgi:hypothetical protein